MLGPHLAPSRRCAVLAILVAATAAGAADPCVFTVAELQAATGRSFIAGEKSKDVSGAPLCSYAQVDRPKRKLLVGVVSERARARFDAQQRMLARGKPIALSGAGDAAYFTGVAAGVVQGERFVFISNLRSASDPKLEPAHVVELLRMALERTGPAPVDP